MKWSFFMVLIAVVALSLSAHAWDQKGHRVAAAIAWDHMEASTRTKAAAILRGAAPMCGIDGVTFDE